MKTKVDIKTLWRRALFVLADIASVVLAMLGAVLVCVNFSFVT